MLWRHHHSDLMMKTSLSDKLLIFKLNRSLEERESILSATQFAWILSPERAKKAEYVLAVNRQGLIIGVFVAKKWLRATSDNFPGMPSYNSKRWGFTGKEAPPEVSRKYLNYRIPADLRKWGTANPVRFVNI